jgi:L-seryl-tRNA(Ser) seleniumtransferase
LLAAEQGQAVVTDAARAVLQEVRAQLLADAAFPGEPALVAAAADRVAVLVSPTLRPVINATGVVVHTNLGRAPLSQAALAAMAEVGAGYSNLEYDLTAGERGSRYSHATALLQRLTGAEAALVVNNNAAAVMLILAALARDREVIIARGQLVEIGGGFRIPEVMAASGARLVEVGTTNRTYVEDYGQAITENTAALLWVHASNFRVVGFTHQASLEELVALGRERGLLVINDLGSGSLLDTAQFDIGPEPTVQAAVAAGADLVCFSGDKLLGGPQAGIIVGRAELIGRIARFPMTRAVRVDKTTLAGLQATLLSYVRGKALEEIPIWRMIAAPLAQLEARAQGWAQALAEAGIPAEVIAGESTVGGGSLPGESLPTRLLALAPAPWRGSSTVGAGLRPGLLVSVETVAARLRAGQPPVVARIDEGRLLLDPRTVLPEQDQALVVALIVTIEGSNSKVSNGLKVSPCHPITPPRPPAATP